LRAALTVPRLFIALNKKNKKKTEKEKKMKNEK